MQPQENQVERDRRTDEFTKIDGPRLSKKMDPSFMPSNKAHRTNNGLEHDQNNQNNHNERNQHQKQKKQMPRQQKKRQHRSNKNPIAPIKQSIKMLEDLQKNFLSVGKMTNQYKPKQFEIKLDQCLTLKLVKKLDHGGYIKKVLNVPTFKVYFLEQKPISSKDSKTLIHKTLDKWNSCPTNSYQLKNIDLYWNTPQQFVSLLYDYIPCYSLENVLNSCGNLSEQALAQKLFQIILMLSLFEKQGIQHPKISSSEILISYSGLVKVRPNINLGHEQSKEQESMVYQIIKWIQPQQKKSRFSLKIGLFALYLVLGVFIMQEEIQQAIFQMDLQNRGSHSSCCLVHKLDQYKDRLPIYTLSKKKWSKNFEDFLCRCLSFDRKRRLQIENMKKHIFISRHQQIQKTSFMDLLQLCKLQNSVTRTNEAELGFQQQLHRVSDSIRMILSHSAKPQFQLPIRADNPSLEYLEEQIGLDRGTIMEMMNRIYSKFR